MRAYLLRLICAAILTALVDGLAGSGAGSGIRRLTTGIFLTLVAFSLPGNLELPELHLEEYLRQAEIAASEGAEQASSAQSDIISESLAAYIGTKAGELGLTVTAELRLDEELRPCAVVLTGVASPLQRQELTDTLVRELGLAKEAVTWTQMDQDSE